MNGLKGLEINKPVQNQEQNEAGEFDPGPSNVWAHLIQILYDKEYNRSRDER